MSNTIDKPWGYEVLWARSEGKYVGKILHLHPQSSLSLQYHQRKEETLMLLTGEAYISFGRDRALLVEERMQVGVPYHLEPGTIHRVWTLEQAADMVEVSTDDLDDVVRLEDRYGRVT